MIDTAKVWGDLSYCIRLKVGAVLSIDDRIIATGRNGMPMGSKSNVCECPDNHTKPQVIHAEMNAILFCAKYGIMTDGATLYVTHVPCSGCAASIFHAGIKRVVYGEDYRDMSGVKELENYGIKVEKLQEV